MSYDQDFLGGDSIPLPDLSARLATQAHDQGNPIDHTRFSIIFHATRALAICTAHNIDGATLLAEGVIPRDDRFRLDREVDRDLQLDNDRGYRNNPWDRGHLVRRRSLHWGDQQEAETADNESYFWTNIAPQHERLHDTAWGPIEDWMLNIADAADQRAAVFTGPIMTEDDPFHQNGDNEIPFQVPAGFWKLIVITHQGERTIAAFLVWQRDFDSPHPVSFSPFLEQVRLTTVEFLTGLSFPQMRHLDPLQFGATAGLAAGGVVRVAPPNAILSPQDIVL